MADRTSKLYNGVYKATNITGGPDLVSCHGYLANTRNMVINGDFTNKILAEKSGIIGICCNDDTV